MAYRLYNDNRENGGALGESCGSGGQCDPGCSQRVRINSVLYEGIVEIDTEVVLPAPLGVSFSSDDGSIEGELNVQANGRPKINWRINNNILFLEGLAPFTVTITPSAPGVQEINMSISAPVSAAIRLKNSLPSLPNMQAEVMCCLDGASIIGFPSPFEPSKSNLLLKAAFSSEICITAPRTVDCMFSGNRLR